MIRTLFFLFLRPFCIHFFNISTADGRCEGKPTKVMAVTELGDLPNDGEKQVSTIFLL